MAACLFEGFGTGPPEQYEDVELLVSRVKALQREGGPAKQAWRLYCRRHGSMDFDPKRHTAKFLMGFVQSMGSADQGQSASEDVEAKLSSVARIKAALEAKLSFVARIEAMQCSSPETRQLWHDWCQKHATPSAQGGVPSYDPSHHDEDVLRRFLEAFDSGAVWGAAAGSASAGAGDAGGNWCGDWSYWAAASDSSVGASARWPSGAEGYGGFDASAVGAASCKGGGKSGADGCGWGGKGGADGCGWGGKGGADGCGWGGKGGADGFSFGNKGDWGPWSGADWAASGGGKAAGPWQGGSGGADGWWSNGKGWDAAAWSGCDSSWGGGSDSVWPPTWGASVKGAGVDGAGNGATTDMRSAACGLWSGGMCGLTTGGKGEKGKSNADTWFAASGSSSNSEFGILDRSPPAELLAQKRGAVSSPAAVASGNNSPGLMTEEQAMEFQRMLKRAKH